MNLSIKNYIGNGSDWDAFVVSRPEGSNYHLYGWRKVIEKTFHHKTFYLTARNNTNEICGLLPLVHMHSSFFGSFLVSLPFFNYGGMLCNNDATAELLLKESHRLLEECKAEFVELRHLDKPLNRLVTKQHKVAMILDLGKDEETQWKELDAKVRNQIRKAEKSELLAISGHMELLDGFYDVFCRNMRDLGTPVYSKGFFRHILEAFPDTTRIISVTLDGKIVASGFIVWFRDTLEVPWASSIRDYRDKCPNNILYWEAIKLAIAMKVGRFDFGRSTPGEGTFRFKKQWGAQPAQLHWQYLLGNGQNVPELNPGNPKYRSAIKVWQHLPVVVTKVLGPLIVRNIP